MRQRPHKGKRLSPHSIPILLGKEVNYFLVIKIWCLREEKTSLRDSFMQGQTIKAERDLRDHLVQPRSFDREENRSPENGNDLPASSHMENLWVGIGTQFLWLPIQGSESYTGSVISHCDWIFLKLHPIQQYYVIIKHPSFGKP